MTEMVESIKSKIRSIPDFPQEGVLFRDITTLLKDAEGWHTAIDAMQKTVEDLEFDTILGPESRGFIFGATLAYSLHKGFVPVRKPGKLPAKFISTSYALEYGEAELQIHEDALYAGQKVIVVDDLLATGGTAQAVIRLVESVGVEVVGVLFLIELKDLKGREVLQGYPVYSIVQY